MTPREPAPDPLTAARHFALGGAPRAAAPWGRGHVHETFAVRCEGPGGPRRYVLQSINTRIFGDVAALMGNIRRVTEHAWARAAAAAGPAEADRRSLRVVATLEGESAYREPCGRWWRCYPFVEGARALEGLATRAQAREAARAFGAFLALVADLPAPRLCETIPGFHDTRGRLQRLRAAVCADPLGRAAAEARLVREVLARGALVDRLAGLQAQGAVPERIAHNDAKVDNVLFEESGGGALCVVDLDTVMPGSALHDFGDLVRSGANAVAEDDPDVSAVEMRLPFFTALAEGYWCAAGGLLTAAERAELAFCPLLITYEQAIRFLTDYIEGDVYYRTRRPGHNLERARNQFALLRSMEAQEAAMRAAVERLPEP